MVDASRPEIRAKAERKPGKFKPLGSGRSHSLNFDCTGRRKWSCKLLIIRCAVLMALIVVARQQRTAMLFPVRSESAGASGPGTPPAVDWAETGWTGRHAIIVQRIIGHLKVRGEDTDLLLRPLRKSPSNGIRCVV